MEKNDERRTRYRLRSSERSKGNMTEEAKRRVEQKESFYTRAEKHECFEEVPIYVVELPTKEHNRPDVKEAKRKEIENLKSFNTFEEVDDEGQEVIDSRWVITEKEEHDGQKSKIKARIVAKGFQEAEKPQSDSPTVSRESLKMFVAIAANENFKICSMDITGAFLQADKLDRDVFLKPPLDIRKERPGILWKLVKPLYGLDDSSRKFYLRVKKMFLKKEMKILPSDYAYFYYRKGDKLVGQAVIHVDDFFIAGTDEFLDWFEQMVKNNLKVSRVEHGRFRFTGVDIFQDGNKIEVSMNAYANSLVPIEDFRKGENTEELNALELKIYRKYTGKLLWLAENCRPDIAYLANQLSKKSHLATLSDLKFVNKVLKKVKERDNVVVYSAVGAREELVVKNMSDASYLKARDSVGGSLVMMGTANSHKLVPLYWKSKGITKISTSTKDAETHALFKSVGDAAFAATNIETLLYDDSQNRIKVQSFIDSKPLLETLASTRIVENKFLIAEVNALKKLLEDGVVQDYTWVETGDQLADVLTKDMHEPCSFRDVFLRNSSDMLRFSRNPKAVLKIHNVGTEDENKEIRLENSDKCKKDV